MKKVILVTGISSGFGKAAGSRLAARGHIVYGTLREDAETDRSVRKVIMDLTDTASVRNAVEYVIGKEGRIDVLINNAGMHVGGPVETTPEEYIRKQLDTNFNGMALLTGMILPHMRHHGKGTIINISSIGGLMGLPFQSFYSASKFATEGFSEALRMEVMKYNIKVVVINPGDFSTRNTENRRNFLAPSGENDPYREQFSITLSKIENDERKGWDPEIMAGKLCRIAESSNPRQRYIIGSLEQRFSVFLKRILPGSIFTRLIMGYYRIK